MIGLILLGYTLIGAVTLGVGVYYEGIEGMGDAVLVAATLVVITWPLLLPILVGVQLRKARANRR